MKLPAPYSLFIINKIQTCSIFYILKSQSNKKYTKNCLVIIRIIPYNNQNILSCIISKDSGVQVRDVGNFKKHFFFKSKCPSYINLNEKYTVIILTGKMNDIGKFYY